MANGIYIYAEVFHQKVEEYTAELVKAAKDLHSNMPITVMAFGDNTTMKQLQWKNVSVLILSVNEDHEFQDGERAKILAEVLKEKDPAIVLLPATATAKSLFSRVSVLMNVGMTADATEIYMEAGTFKQKKPAFGNNVMVVTEETDWPAIVTLVTGIYEKEENGVMDGIEMIHREMEDSSIELLGLVEQETESIVNANRIISLGKGAIDENGYELAKELASKMGAAIGGTRPLVDNGMIPFEAQIGQTGCVVHPDCCLFLGVSGAIQHTEGVRDSNVTIAVNHDPDAAIFTFADYGIVADSNEIMKALLKRME
ncbi:MAG: electron transfer flavoprotein subunit alpha/FixB family protein [Eubacteriales bacterium]|nr:electron transfer flavoprotein subunit alpha/FixB family protein [Eubacteriales bacterium]